MPPLVGPADERRTSHGIGIGGDVDEIRVVWVERRQSTQIMDRFNVPPVFIVGS